MWGDFVMRLALNTRLARLLSVSVVCGMAAIGVVRAAGVAEGDAKAGSTVFEASCGNCHTVKEGKHKSGPSLFGVVGRQAATEKNFEYSDALKAANLTWTPETLNTFITNPKGLVEKTKMKFAGMPNETNRANLLAFLAEQK